MYMQTYRIVVVIGCGIVLRLNGMYREDVLKKIVNKQRRETGIFVHMIAQLQ
jgi:hypothetical protein